MAAIVPTLMSAVVYGISDFTGDRTNRRFAPIAIATYAEVAGIAIVGVSVPLLAGGEPTGTEVGGDRRPGSPAASV